MVEISIERFTELCHAEQEAKQFKMLIQKKMDDYGTIDRDDIKLLYLLYCDKEGEEC